MWREKNIYFTEPDIYFTKLMFILKNINLELKSALSIYFTNLYSTPLLAFSPVFRSLRSNTNAVLYFVNSVFVSEPLSLSMCSHFFDLILKD